MNVDNAAIKDNFSDLSEFFSTLSKEKDENRKKLENTIAVLEDDKAPEDTPINISEDTLEPQIIRSDLANLFKNLENALQETKEEPIISFEVEPEPEPELESIRGLSFDEQTRLDEFSKLITSFNTTTLKPVKKVEIIDIANEEEKLESFSNLMDSLNETKEEDPVEEEKPVETVVVTKDETEEEDNIVHSVWAQIENPTKNKVVNVKEAPEVDFIQDAVDKITDIKSKNPRQFDVHEKPITDFQSLQKEFITFKQRVVEQLSSLGGGGAIKINDMEDLVTSGRADGDSLIYNASTNKYTHSAASASVNLSLEDSIDGNLLMDGTDSSGTDAGDDFLQESGVNSGRDFDHSVLQGLTSNIIPQAGGTYDLGTPTKRFRNLYLESDTVDIGGALISSDGSGQITISADGVTLPTGSKDAEGFELARITADSGQTFKVVKLFTQASGLSTAAAEFKFNAELSNVAVYTEAGHTFTLSNGDARSDAGADLFQF